MESWVAGREKRQDRSSRSYLSHYYLAFESSLVYWPQMQQLVSILPPESRKVIDFFLPFFFSFFFEVKY